MEDLDSKISFSELKSKVSHFNSERKWEQFHTPKEVAISISIEASELLEIFQWKSLTRSDIKLDKNKIEHIQEEIADILIYIMSLANTLEIDLSSAVLKKLELNEKKYPSKFNPTNNIK